MINLSDLHHTPDNLAYLIEEVAWGRATWQQVLIALSELSPGGQVHSVHHNPEASRALILDWQGIDDSIAMNYQKYYINIDPWAPVLAALSNGSTFSSQQHMPADTFKNTEYYNDHLRLMGIHRAWTGIKLDTDQKNNFFLALHYPIINSDVLDTFFSKLLSELRGPLSRLIDLSNLVEEKRQETIIHTIFSVETDKAAFIVDGQMNLIGANKKGELFLKEGTLLKYSGGKLRVINNEIKKKITHYIYELQNSPLSTGKRIGGNYCGDRVIFEFTRVSRDCLKPLLYSPSFILITISEIDKQHNTPDEILLKSLFKLSKTESKICICILNGYSLMESACAIGITYEHARQRIKSIFIKTKTCSQMELCLLLSKIYQ